MSKELVATRMLLAGASVVSLSTSVGVDVSEPRSMFGFVSVCPIARTVPALMTSVSVEAGGPGGNQFCGSLKLPVPPNHVCAVVAVPKSISVISVDHVLGAEVHSWMVQKWEGSLGS